MKLLHTSDWHLGRTLYSKKDRQEEHAAFLKWLMTALKENAADLLIVAGDIFDTNSPSNSSQKMYYDFLLKVRDTGCQNVIIVGGNHDSPGFLNAPKEILAAINVHVIGNVSDNTEDEVFIVRDKEGNPSAIVCAVPFLRERDLSRFTEAESYSDRSKRITENIRKHYEKVAEIAEKVMLTAGNSAETAVKSSSIVISSLRSNTKEAGRKRFANNVIARNEVFLFPDIEENDEKIMEDAEIVTKMSENEKSVNREIPVIATGHLSVAGGKTVEDDGVRDIYIGNIECVSKEMFPLAFDYVALGHYHIASVIDKHVRYSGSPIPMGFGEANKKKSVYLVDFDEKMPTVTTLEIPVFQKMESIRGDKSFISNRLTELKKLDSSNWVEIIYDGDDVFPDLTVWANEMTANTKIEIIKLQNRQHLNEVLTQNENKQSLDDLDKFEVFDILLEKNNFSTERKEELKNLYQEIAFLVEN